MNRRRSRPAGAKDQEDAWIFDIHDRIESRITCEGGK
jgi:hypothetical protein